MAVTGRHADDLDESAESQCAVVWDPVLTEYDFGVSHPMAPARLALTARLCADLGLFNRSGVRVVPTTVASDELLALVHDPDFIDSVRKAGADPSAADASRGLGTEDDPAFLGMHEASARIVGASVDMARAVWTGAVRHGVNFCGGLHHAMHDRASGFCVYNDCAVAIQWLLNAGARRVAYVDVDVHHGDGTERLFWDDPRVMTISLHESGHVLFPGTGFAWDVGGPGAEGYAVNVALPPGTGDGGWLRALHAVVPPLLREFEADVLVTQHGCDTHALDPLAHLRLSVDAQRAAAVLLHELGHECSGGRWVALGGGGYEIVDVVPRTWAHLVGVAAHAPVDPPTPTPQSWRAYVERLLHRPAPRRMTDGQAATWRPWSGGFNPDDAVDQAIMATREAVFPLHGLDVHFG